MTRKVDPTEFLDQVILPALFERLDSAFPDFGWRPDGRGWKATDSEYTQANVGARADRVICHEPFGFYVHGGRSQTWMSFVNGGPNPRGSDFFDALKKLATYAGVDASPLDREPTEEEARAYEAKGKRRGVLEAVQAYAQDRLWTTDEGRRALAYLQDERGFSDEEIKALGFGLYPPASELREALTKEGQDIEIADEAGLLKRTLEGFVVIPWADASGNPFTIHTRWPGEPPRKSDHPGWSLQREAERAKWERMPGDEKAKSPWREPIVPKTVALPGEGLKSVPLYFDRAHKAGHKEIVVVEGILDAAIAQARGDTRVVAVSGSSITVDQIKTLARYKIRAVTLVPDPDKAGANGVAGSVASLAKAEISAYVASAPPGDLDPDEFINDRGIKEWKAHVQAAVPGGVYQGIRILDGVTPDSPAIERDLAVEKIIDLYGTLSGHNADLARIDLLKLLEKQTGYPAEILETKAEVVSARRLSEEQQRDAKRAIKEAYADLEKGKPYRDVTGRLSECLDAFRVQTTEFPASFSVDRLDREARDIPPGKSLGWKKVDALDAELHAGELAVLAARTGHGKTTVMVNLFVNLLIDSNENDDEIFVFYSAEESELRIYHRLLALLASFEDKPGKWTVNSVRDRLQYPSEAWHENMRWGTRESFESARSQLRSWESRLLIVHRPGWSITDIEADARRIASNRRVGAVCADYLQRIGPPRDMTKGRRRDEEVSAIARRFKILAEDLSVPVVTGAQINRKAIEDGKKTPIEGDYGTPSVMKLLASRRPQLHHLREGGSEQEADLVLGLMNYAADYTEGDENRSVPSTATRLEIGVLKNRYGPSGKWAKLAFEGQYGVIRDPRSEVEV